MPVKPLTNLILAVLSKSPFPCAGRVGLMENQDFYRTCQETVEAFKKLKQQTGISPIVLVPTAVCLDGQSEAEFYEKKLLELGIPTENLKVIEDGYETIGQIDAVMEVLEHGYFGCEDCDEVVFVSTWLHSFRVRWLTWGYKKNVYHIVCGGIPRPREAITDLFLIIPFIIIDVIGLRGLFQRLVIARRQAGKL